MLPYRLRAPPKAGPWKNIKEVDPFHSGGPMQRAIEHDIQDILPAFLNAELVVTDDHAEAGATFQLFSSLFASSKLGLLHSCTVPPRCDQDAYVQLIYASCLNLIQKSIQEEGSSLRKTSFGLFCLYAFFQTCPLPMQTENELQMLPMGLQGENPKKQFRRHFKTRIRIDAYHYSLLQRLGDAALAMQAGCQVHRLEAKANTWSCQCSVATDLIHVLNRLKESWDYSMYTGPRSVEGLAGHSDYPFGCIRPKKIDDPLVIDPLLDSGWLDDATSWSASLDWRNLSSAMDNYKQSLRSLALPNAKDSNQAKRIRDAVNPIFAQEAWDEVFLQITNDEAALATSLPISHAQSLEEDHVGEDECVAASDHLPSKNDNEKPTPLVLLPAGLRAATAAAIQNVVESLFKSGELTPENVPTSVAPDMIADEVSSVRFDGVSVASQRGANALRKLLKAAIHSTDSVSSTGATSMNDLGAGKGTNALRKLLQAATSEIGVVTNDSRRSGTGRRLISKPPATRKSPDILNIVNDELLGSEALQRLLSTVNSTDSVTVGASSVKSQETGQGRAALQALLSSISGQTATPSIPFTISREARRNPQCFLTMTARDSDIDADSDDVSDVSSASFDEVSVAASAVGQVALRKLLSAVNEETAITKRKSKKKSAVVVKKRKIETKGESRPQRAKLAKKSHTETLPVEIDDCISTTSSRHFGRAALDHLLAQVATFEGHADN